ncbi:acyl-CoA N-acyltransferase [Russula vinacea]|nr:acyl-CoA N-acyltransferase [Russula vinacea]
MSSSAPSRRSLGAQQFYEHGLVLMDGEGDDIIRHGRTMDFFAGAVNRENASGVLWYMADGMSWEVHMATNGRHIDVLVRRGHRGSVPASNHRVRRRISEGTHDLGVDGAKEKRLRPRRPRELLIYRVFLFYTFTDADSQRDHVFGFFSKEKISYDDYNLACFVVLPSYQKKGYDLSRRAGRIGTPERPLSDLGLRSYLAYWVSTIVRFLRQLLSTLPPDLPPIKTSPFPALSHQKRTKCTKGWDGESAAPRLPESGSSASPATRDNVAFSSSGPAAQVPLDKMYETVPAQDGSAAVHTVVHCMLADLARATNLRVEDAAFALNGCGLLVRREGEGDTMTTAISQEMVEAVARDRNVKRMCIDFTKVLL